MTLVRSCLLFSALIASAMAPAAAFAQASATATASVQIIEPIGIGMASAGGVSTLPGSTAGVAQLSGGAFSVQGPANQVVSISATLPADVERVDGDGALPVTAPRAVPSRMLTAEGLSGFVVSGTAPSRSAAAGLYAGTAQVVVNLN